MPDGIHVHIVGYGNVTKLLLGYLAKSKAVGRITVSGRNHHKIRALLDDLSQGTQTNFPLCEVAELGDIHPDIVLVACGATIRPGQLRAELLATNLKIAFEFLGDNPPSDAFYIIVTNPVDILTDAIRIKYKLNPRNIVGVGGDLDANRIRWAIRDPSAEVAVLGEHGESAVYIINGMPLNGLSQKTHHIRESIRASLDAQLTYFGAPLYGPGNAVVSLVDDIIHGNQTLHYLSIYLKEWDATLTWPVIITGPSAEPNGIDVDSKTLQEIAAIAERHKNALAETK